VEHKKWSGTRQCLRFHRPGYIGFLADLVAVPVAVHDSLTPKCTFTTN